MADKKINQLDPFSGQIDSANPLVVHDDVSGDAQRITPSQIPKLTDWDATGTTGTPASIPDEDLVKATGTFTDYTAYGTTIISGNVYAKTSPTTLSDLSAQGSGGGGGGTSSQAVVVFDDTQATDASVHRYATFAEAHTAAAAIATTGLPVYLDISPALINNAFSTGNIILPGGTYDGHGLITLGMPDASAIAPIHNDGTGIVFQDFAGFEGIQFVNDATTTDVRVSLTGYLPFTGGRTRFKKCTLAGKTGAGAYDLISTTAAVGIFTFEGCNIQDHILTTAGSFCIIEFEGGNRLANAGSQTGYSFQYGSGQTVVRGKLPVSNSSNATSRWALFNAMVSYDVSAWEPERLIIDSLGLALPFRSYTDCLISPSVAATTETFASECQLHGNCVISNVWGGDVRLGSTMYVMGNLGVTGTDVIKTPSGTGTIRILGTVDMPVGDEWSGAGTKNFELYGGKTTHAGSPSNGVAPQVAPSNIYEFRAAQVRALYAASDVTQTPSGLGTPMQVSFGSASTAADVDIDASGTCTFKYPGNYRIRVELTLRGTGLVGGAIMPTWVEKNGLQFSGSNTKITRIGTTGEFTEVVLDIMALNVAIGDTLEVFTARDNTAAVNEGEVAPYTPALTSGTPNAVPSAVLTMFRDQ